MQFIVSFFCFYITYISLFRPHSFFPRYFYFVWRRHIHNHFKFIFPALVPLKRWNLSQRRHFTASRKNAPRTNKANILEKIKVDSIWSSLHRNVNY